MGCKERMGWMEEEQGGPEEQNSKSIVPPVMSSCMPQYTHPLPRVQVGQRAVSIVLLSCWALCQLLGCAHVCGVFNDAILLSDSC